MRFRPIRFQRARGHAPIVLALLLTSTDIASSQNVMEASRDARIQRITDGLRPPVAIKGQPPSRWTLAERMASLHVPGVSIAVIEHGEIAWARGFGVKDAGTTDSVTASTLFEAQSISKAVTATAVLVLIRSGQLSLDRSANTYLKSWKIPDNEYQSPQQVTIRRILSHSAGFTVGGFEGYRTGDAMPTLLQILDGRKPANNPPIRVDFIPGSKVRYSGGGMEVMQQILVDVTGQPFPDLMKRLVLAPVGMTSSTYQQPLPEALWSEAASGHDGDGNIIRGKWPIQPEMAAAGLWTTPSDLAKWALAISNAWRGGVTRLLSKNIATEMLTVQKAPYGLGVELQGAGPTLEFSHAGSNAGYRAMVVMFPEAGKGAVIMTNGDKGDPLIGNLLTSIAAEYQWPGRTQTEREAITLSAAQLDGLVGIYSMPPGPSGEPVTYEVTRTVDSLYGELKGLGLRPKSELYPSSASSVFATSGLEITFTLDKSGRATALKFGSFDAPRKADPPPSDTIR
jgi:CubicO group peptidase (beta-lactamase class C family)